MFGMRVVRRIFIPKQQEVTELKKTAWGAPILCFQQV
jgi:hypothetical protein